ncbi:MAG: aminopeptidase P family N-terminal domain-containing protein [Burkholderiales bacterium]|nr:aminopeptidase P family N-terminal domain-containing protein [Burkholderiales bacterium]
MRFALQAQRLAALRVAMHTAGIDAYLIPRSDEHQGEYVAAYAERLSWLTGFTGSAGMAIAMKDSAAVFIDGRYTLQVRDQVDLNVFETRSYLDVPKWIGENLKAGQKLAYDPWLHTETGVKALKEACPDGIDGYFENVGGMILDAVMLRCNAFSRIAFCGMIAGYNGEPIPMANPSLILVNRMKLEGFIVSEHMQLWPEALKELGTMVATGKFKYRETVAQGLQSAPEAFLGLLKGRNFGKQLVKLV